MRKTNKLMALLIALAMLASMMSFTATVSAENSVTTVEVSEADIALSVKLKILGVITNELEMSSYVTRGEMASIAVKYANVPASTDKQAFPDVAPEHPYYGAIGALYNMGVITGDENGNFNPDNYVTYDEALVYIINAIGHKPFAVREGGYPTGYHRIAIKHDMLEDLSMNKGTDKATLADIYKMLDKGLTAATVITSYYGNGDVIYTLSETETFLSANYKINEYRGIITGIPGTRLTSVASDIKKDQIEINNKRYELYGYPEFNMLGYCVDYYVSSEEPDVILHVEETKRRNELLRINAEDLDKAKSTDTRVYYRDDDDREYHIDLDLNFSMIYNNQYYDMYGVLSRVLPDNGYIEVLDNNGDGIYDTLFIFTYFNAYVEGVSSDGTSVRDKISGKSINLDEYQQVVNVYFNGSRKLTADSIQLGDVLSIVESKGTPKIKSVYISRNVVTGKIEAQDSVRGYYINGEWYELADPAYAANLSLGTQGTFYLDINNEIAYHSLDMSTRKGDSAVMSAVNYKIRNLGSTIEVRLFTSKGEFLYAELKNNIKIDGKRYDIGNVSEATTVVEKLAPNYVDGQRKVDSAYVVNYVIDDDDKITELDLGGIKDPGTLNVQRLGATSMLLATGKILSYTNDNGNTSRLRINPKNSVVFGVPDDGKLDDLKQYRITSLVEQHNYGNDVNKLAYGEEDYASSIDIYSYAETEYPMVDVVLLRGAAAVSEFASRNNSLDIITDIGQTVTEDGELAYKLYMANGEYLMSSKVNLTELTVETPEVDAATIITKLHKGLVIQYVVDNDDMISAIRLVAEYDNGTLKPLFKNASTYVELGDGSGSYDSYSGNNTVMGIIDGIDFESKQAYFRTPVSQNANFLLYLTNESLFIYDSATGEVTKGSNADILPEDKFVAHLATYYIPQTLIIFR